MTLVEFAFLQFNAVLGEFRLLLVGFKLQIGNQLLATIVLWTAAAYLTKKGKPHWMCSLPATFLTFVCVSYFVMTPHENGGLHLAPAVGYVAGVVSALSLLCLCVISSRKTVR